jgi:hypothetical protein
MLAASIIRAVLAASIIRTIALMMEAASTSVMSVNFYQITRRSNPETAIFSCYFI